MKHGEHVNDTRGDEIDNAIRALDQLANVGAVQLRNYSAGLGKPLEAIGGGEKPLHMKRCIPG